MGQECFNTGGLIILFNRVQPERFSGSQVECSITFLVVDEMIFVDDCNVPKTYHKRSIKELLSTIDKQCLMCKVL